MKHLSKTWRGPRIFGAILILSAWSIAAMSQNEATTAMSPKARVELATQFEKKKDYRKVVLTLSTNKDVIGRSGLILLARAYAHLSMRSEDIATLELANARTPKDATLQTLLAGALSRAGKKDAAIEMLYTAKTTNPKFVPAYDALLAELVAIDSRQEARDLISDMVKRFNMQPRWASELCHLYSLDAFHTKTIEICNRAIRADPKNPKNPVYLANSYREQAEPEKAKNVLLRAAKRLPKSEPIQTATGDYFVETKNFVDAFKWYSAAVKTDSKSYGAQIGLAQAALELQKMEESVTAFTAACILKREAIREFQAGLIKIRNRGDAKWQRRFEEAIMNNCRLHD